MKNFKEFISEGKEAKWSKTDVGPNKTKGYILMLKDKNDWKSSGFVREIPKNIKGKIEVYNGGEDITIDLSKYKFVK